MNGIKFVLQVQMVAPGRCCYNLSQCFNIHRGISDTLYVGRESKSPLV